MYNTLSLSFTRSLPSIRENYVGSFLSSYHLPWAAVYQRFEQFHNNLLLTPEQQKDGYTKRGSVVKCLNRFYYNSESFENNSFFIGSWGKDTVIRPPRDVDIYFVLPIAVYQRFENYTWNRQSALLQEVKNRLAATFPNTDMSGDGQVVVVNFISYKVEVVPAFSLTDGSYYICQTQNSGSYKKTTPQTEAQHIESVDKDNAYNLRPLIRMLKSWQDFCSVPIKSFYLELLATEFIAQSAWGFRSWLFFDWLIRDFFVFLYSRANSTISVPGTFEKISLGNAWQSRAESAYYRAYKACAYEYDNCVREAGKEWQKIFGNNIPRIPD